MKKKGEIKCICIGYMNHFGYWFEELNYKKNLWDKEIELAIWWYKGTINTLKMY